MAPFLPSWLGSGTSIRCFLTTLMGGGVEGFPVTSPGLDRAVAGLALVLEMKAIGWVRNVVSAAEGLAVRM